jgi:hypothetical protein
MTLEILTLVLDGEPFIEQFLPELERLKTPWVWRVAEGVADNTHCTNWCRKIHPRLSRDGTSEYLTSISRHPNVRLYRRQLWDGKVTMLNTMLADIKDRSVLLERDVDEMWSAEQMEKIVELYDTGLYDRMRFFCRYFVGENIVTIGENCYGNNPGEWSRSWLFDPKMRFQSHEPPVLKGCGTRELTREQTRELGLVFNHFAYCSEKTLKFKEVYYSYRDAVAHWRRLQANTVWPCRLKDFLPWVDDKAMADKVTP